MENDIGIMGTGRMGVRLAAMFANAGRTVVLGSRDRARADEIVKQLGIPELTSGTYQNAVKARAIVPAIFIRDDLFEVLGPFSADLRDKPLIDISNPFNEDYSDFLTPWDSSGAEELQKRLPDSHVVGAFKNVYWAVFDEPLFGGTPSDVFVIGDNEAAKQTVLQLTDGTPFRYLDAGPLINARAIERLTMITGALGRKLGSYPRMNWRLLD